jgi:phage shock protein A
MNSFRRWTIGVCAKFDDLLGQVENHEALAAQALRDMRTSLARANGQLARVERDCRVLETEIGTAREHAERWRARAQKEGADDRALECLRRSRAAMSESHKLTERLEDQRRMRDQVRRTIQGLEQKFLDLSGKQRLLSTRQAAAQASEAINAETGAAGDVEDVFSRWELKLTEKEFTPRGYAYTDDAFDDGFCQEYDKEEERASLEAELSTLRRENDVADEAEQPEDAGKSEGLS